ncbi:hypothetical protein GGR50DRAFT_94622 [Xylaria sp. CBS 124048]|nr:hypothetical protein GGR50DRAFT_94622 [Xylaria sp. CBS 124048]
MLRSMILYLVLLSFIVPRAKAQACLTSRHGLPASPDSDRASSSSGERCHELPMRTPPYFWDKDDRSHSQPYQRDISDMEGRIGSEGNNKTSTFISIHTMAGLDRRMKSILSTTTLYVEKGPTPQQEAQLPLLSDGDKSKRRRS